MPIAHHPARGSIVVVNFDKGFKAPEMVKRRLAVVLTPKMKDRPSLCAVVPLSTTEPNPARPYHTEIDIPFALPKPWENQPRWVKGDMVCVVAMHRIELLRFQGKKQGRRQYQTSCLDEITFRRVRLCVLHGLGFSTLTKHL